MSFLFYVTANAVTGSLKSSDDKAICSPDGIQGAALLPGTWKPFMWTTESPLAVLAGMPGSAGVPGATEFRQVTTDGTVGELLFTLENGGLTRTSAQILSEHGAPLTVDDLVWTGGNLQGGGQHTCGHWDASALGTYAGAYGSANQSDSWLELGITSPCAQVSHHVYCVQVTH